MLLLPHKYSAPLQKWYNWCHLLLLTSRWPSRANGGAPVPVPDNINPLIPPPSHLVHMSHPDSSKPISSYHPAHKIQFLQVNPRLIPIRSSRYNPNDPSNTIQCLLWREPLNKTNHNQKDLSSVTSAADFSPSPVASAARHLLSSSSVSSYAALFASYWDISIPEANFWTF